MSFLLKDRTASCKFFSDRCWCSQLICSGLPVRRVLTQCDGDVFMNLKTENRHLSCDNSGIVTSNWIQNVHTLTYSRRPLKNQITCFPYHGIWCTTNQELYFKFESVWTKRKPQLSQPWCRQPTEGAHPDSDCMLTTPRLPYVPCNARSSLSGNEVETSCYCSLSAQNLSLFSSKSEWRHGVCLYSTSSWQKALTFGCCPQHLL